MTDKKEVKNFVSLIKEKLSKETGKKLHSLVYDIGYDGKDIGAIIQRRFLPFIPIGKTLVTMIIPGEINIARKYYYFVTTNRDIAETDFLKNYTFQYKVI